MYRGSGIQARHDGADVNAVASLKYARAELVVRIPARSMVPDAQRNCRPVRRFLPDSVRTCVSGFDTGRSSTDKTGQCPDPRQIQQISDGFHSLHFAENSVGPPVVPALLTWGSGRFGWPPFEQSAKYSFAFHRRSWRCLTTVRACVRDTSHGLAGSIRRFMKGTGLLVARWRQ